MQDWYNSEMNLNCLKYFSRHLQLLIKFLKEANTLTARSLKLYWCMILCAPPITIKTSEKWV